MPTLRAISISSLVSIVNVTMPSTSLGCSPASSIAALTASQASCSSLRPDSFENSVWPMPAIAAVAASELMLDSVVEQAERRRARHVVAEAVAALELDLDEPLAVGALGLAGDAAGERQRIVRERGHAEPDRQLRHHRFGPGPVGEEPDAQPVGGEDVHEDVGRALLLRELADRGAPA